MALTSETVSFAFWEQDSFQNKVEWEMFASISSVRKSLYLHKLGR